VVSNACGTSPCYGFNDDRGILCERKGFGFRLTGIAVFVRQKMVTSIAVLVLIAGNPVKGSMR